MKTRIFPVPICDPAPTPIRGRLGGLHFDRGFTLIEILLAISLLSLIAVTALHSRVILIRADRKARQLDAARLILRGVIALHRAGASVAERSGELPEGWQLVLTEATTNPTGADRSFAWQIWRLTADDGATVLEVATDLITAAAP